GIVRGELGFRDDGTFTVVQFNDTQDGPRTDRRTIALQDAVLEDVRPDVVVLNGDVIDGSPRTAGEAKQALNNVVRPMEDRGIPWALTFGNHDEDSTARTGLDEAGYVDFVRQYTHNVNTAGADGVTGTGNQVLTVRSASAPRDAFALWLIDSGRYAPEQIAGQGFEGYPDWDWVRPDQVRWTWRPPPSWSGRTGRWSPASCSSTSPCGSTASCGSRASTGAPRRTTPAPSRSTPSKGCGTRRSAPARSTPACSPRCCTAATSRACSWATTTSTPMRATTTASSSATRPAPASAPTAWAAPRSITCAEHGSSASTRASRASAPAPNCASRRITGSTSARASSPVNRRPSPTAWADPGQSPRSHPGWRRIGAAEEGAWDRELTRAAAVAGKPGGMTTALAPARRRHAPWSSEPARIEALDLVRLLAVLGMIATHLMVPLATVPTASGVERTMAEVTGTLAEGTTSTLFAVLGGASLVLAARGRLRNGDRRGAVLAGAVRGALIAGV